MQADPPAEGDDSQDIPSSAADGPSSMLIEGPVGALSTTQLALEKTYWIVRLRAIFFPGGEKRAAACAESMAFRMYGWFGVA